MVTIISVFLIVSILLLVSIGYGNLFCGKSSLFTQVLIGFAVFMGLIEITDLILFPFVLTKIPMYFCYVLIIVVGCFYMVTSRFYQLNFNGRKSLFLLGYLFLMIVIISNRTLGEPTFDSVFYLSYVNEWANSLTIDTMIYETGVLTSEISVLYDFQAFYHINAFFLWVVQSINYAITGMKMIVSQIYVWSAMVFFYILLFCFQEVIIRQLELKNKWIKMTISLFLLGIVGNFYWNNSLSFFGNSYRQFYSAVFSLIIYHVLKTKKFEYRIFLIVSLVSSAMLAMSSTSLFLNFIVILGLIYSLLFFSVEDLGRKIAILLFPTVLFGLNYIANSFDMVLIPIIIVVLLYCFCLIYDVFFTAKVKQMFIEFLLKLFKALPILVSLIALLIWIRGEEDIWMFFRNHSSQDMVWDLFSFRNLLYFGLNSIYFCGLIRLINRKAKSAYLKYLLYIVLVFINPFNIVVLKRYLSGIVFYRAYEVVFNYFSFTLLIIGFLKWFEFRENILKIICMFFCILSIIQSVTCYHSIFMVNDRFDKLYKVEEEELDMLLYLNNYLASIEKRMTFVSQMDSLKTFTPNVSLEYGFRGFDKYSLNDSNDELLKIFYPRDYAGQILFEEEPDFKCACDQLINQKIDFVILDKKQVYPGDTGYESLFYQVRDCADLLYENNRYALFRFYW